MKERERERVTGEMEKNQAEVKKGGITSKLQKERKKKKKAKVKWFYETKKEQVEADQRQLIEWQKANKSILGNGKHEQATGG